MKLTFSIDKYWFLVRYEVLRQYIRTLPRKIRLFFKFGKLAWHSPIYDYSFPVTMFCESLLELADYIEKHGHHIASDYDARRIRLAVKLLKSSDGDKVNETWDKIEKKYGKFSLRFDKVAGEDDLYEASMLLGGKQLSGEQTVEVDKALEYARDWENKAHNLAWEIIKRNIKSWWD